MALRLIDRSREGLVVTFVAAVVIACLTLFPSSQRVSQHALCVFCGELGGEDFVLNILLFMPLGVGVKMCGVSPWRALLGTCAVSICIESIQYLAPLGRDASLGDVISNSLGGAAGFVFASYAHSVLKPRARFARILALGAMTAWLLCLVLTAYMVQPAPTRSVYFGQLMRALGGRPGYPGSMRRADLAGAALPDWNMKNSGQVRAALSSDTGATLDIEFVSTGTPTEPSSIARIADADGLEVLHLARDGTSAVYSIRTHADDWRLRPLRFELRDVFAASESDVRPDSIALTANYTTERAGIDARSSAVQRRTTLRVSLSQGWRLLSPADFFVSEHSSVFLDALWLAILPGLAGYWLYCASLGGTPIVCGGIALATIIAGLTVIPYVMGLAHTVWWEAVAPLSGMAAGYAIARPVMKMFRL